MGDQNESRQGEKVGVMEIAAVDRVLTKKDKRGGGEENHGGREEDHHGDCKYQQHTTGVAGPSEIWNVGGMQGQGVQKCYEAVIKDSRCAGDFFTYVSGGDKNCGCRS